MVLRRLKRVDVRLCHLQDLARKSVLSVLPVNAKINAQSQKENFYVTIVVEEQLVRTGQREVDQRRKEKEFKAMVYNIKGKKNLKRLIQLVTALAAIQEGKSARVPIETESGTSVEELATIVTTLVIAGFWPGLVYQDSVVMRLLTWIQDT